MEGKIMLEIAKRIEKGEKVALVTLTEVFGSSPGKVGSVMGVFFDGTTLGTIGGGNLEFQVINSAIEALEIGENRNFDFKLSADHTLDMRCGGEVKGYIKVFQKRRKLVIVGGGHLGMELYKLGKFLNMYTVIIDDREEYANKDRFPKADELISGNIKNILNNYQLDDNSYVVIMTRGHLGDKVALESILNNPNSSFAYLGMIGSRKKIITTYENLLNENTPKERLKSVFSPVGLDISNGDPSEIALGIMAEILKVKNNGSGKHMNQVKSINIDEL